MPMSVNLDDVKLVVFDLDDTLYLEFDFVAGGFQAVAEQLGRKYSRGSSELFHEMLELQRSGRRDIFQAVLTKLAGHYDAVQVQGLVNLYRTADRPLELLDDADRALTRFRQAALPLAILTDGPAEAQKTKVRLLGLKDRADYILYTELHGKEFAKPSPKGFHLLAHRFDVSGVQCLYVADNEKKDFAGPNQLHWQTVKVERDGALYSDHRSAEPLYRPKFTVRSLDELQIDPDNHLTFSN